MAGVNIFALNKREFYILVTLVVFSLCFSATMPPKMQEVLSHVLKKNYVSISTIDASEPPTLAKVPQFSIVIPKPEDTFAALFSIVKEETQLGKDEPKIIVFGTTANLVALYSKVFESQVDLKVYVMHSRMSQAARTKATEAFKAARNGIMFATDGKSIVYLWYLVLQSNQ